MSVIQVFKYSHNNVIANSSWITMGKLFQEVMRLSGTEVNTPSSPHTTCMGLFIHQSSVPRVVGNNCATPHAYLISFGKLVG